MNGLNVNCTRNKGLTNLILIIKPLSIFTVNIKLSRFSNLLLIITGELIKKYLQPQK